MADRDETLRRIAEFNVKAEELRKSSPEPTIPPAVTGAVPSGSLDAELVASSNDALSTAQRIEKQAIVTSSDVQRAKRQEQADENRREQEEGRAIDKVQQSGESVVAGALDAAQPPIRWLENIPTPLGLGTMFVIIVVFLLAIVPVDSAGNTRLKLVWYVITGKAHLAPVPDFAASVPPGVTPTSPTTTATAGQQVPIDLSAMPDLSGLDLTNL